MGVAQHHDSVAGTAKQNVNDDYTYIVAAGRADALASVSASFAALTRATAATFDTCQLSNVTLCPALEAGKPAVVILHNSLGQAMPASNVRLSAGFPAGVKSYAVYDNNGKMVTAQIVSGSSSSSSVSKHGSGMLFVARGLCHASPFAVHPPSRSACILPLSPHLTPRRCL